MAFASLHRDASTTVNFGNDDRAPLLFIAFEHDHIVPPSASRHNAEKYAESKAITEFHEFPDRPHFPVYPVGRRSPTTRSIGRRSMLRCLAVFSLFFVFLSYADGANHTLDRCNLRCYWRDQ